MALKYTAYGINNFDPGHIRLKQQLDKNKRQRQGKEKLNR